MNSQTLLVSRDALGFQCSEVDCRQEARLNFSLEAHISSRNLSCSSEQEERATSENAFKRLPSIDSKLLLSLKWRLGHNRKSVHAEMRCLSASRSANYVESQPCTAPVLPPAGSSVVGD